MMQPLFWSLFYKNINPDIMGFFFLWCKTVEKTVPLAQFVLIPEMIYFMMVY